MKLVLYCKFRNYLQEFYFCGTLQKRSFAQINGHELAKSHCCLQMSVNHSPAAIFFALQTCLLMLFMKIKFSSKFPYLRSGITILFLMIHVPYHEVISGYVYNTSL